MRGAAKEVFVKGKMELERIAMQRSPDLMMDKESPRHRGGLIFVADPVVELPHREVAAIFKMVPGFSGEIIGEVLAIAEHECDLLGIEFHKRRHDIDGKVQALDRHRAIILSDARLLFAGLAATMALRGRRIHRRLVTVLRAVAADLDPSYASVPDGILTDPSGLTGESCSWSDWLLRAGAHVLVADRQAWNQNVLMWFAKYDRNGNGLISKAEFVSAVAEWVKLMIKPPPSFQSRAEEVLRTMSIAMLEELDADRNGALDFEEFRHAIVVLSRRERDIRMIVAHTRDMQEMLDELLLEVIPRRK
mmetsp:Transcript_89464/g.239835  ORF Transcript_89464/g.239835 Transcript_89464/m.239835 type:complete len:305 (+) Transcript_89464:572-1486(+)